MKPVCFVFGAGPPPAYPPKITAQDFVIAVDGGYLYTQSAGIRTNVIIGDFDSLGDAHGLETEKPHVMRRPVETDEPQVMRLPKMSDELLFGHLPKETEKPLVVRLPKEKDQTDTFAALWYGLEWGFTCFHIYGGTGRRFDHTMANIQCLAYLLNHGARGYLYNENTVVTALRTEVWLTPCVSGGIVSVFAIGGPAEGVCLRGLKYGLENVTLSTDFPLGVSNEFTGRTAYIGVERGDLLVTYPAGTQETDIPASKDIKNR